MDNTHATAIGQLAVPATLVAPSTPLTEVDRIFREDRSLRSVVVDGGGGLGLVDRTEFDTLFIGRFGYGRHLHARREIREVMQPQPLLLDAGLDLVAASRRILQRDLDRRYEDVVVTGLDGLASLSVWIVLEELSGVFAHQALHDTLTGLPNRALFFDRLEHAMLRERRESGGAASVAVLFCDLDGFKEINDTLGHEAGDAALLAAAARIRSSIRDSDTLARLGGDEFAVVVERAGRSEVVEVAQRVSTALRAPLLVAGRALDVTVSVGIAESRPAEEPRDLLRRADAAMYEVKQQGGNGVLLGGDVVTHLPHANPDVALERRLRRAIRCNELVLHYQPIVDLLSGRLHHVEALVRWPQPDGTLLPPRSFVRIAERSGLITELTDWVVRTALDQLVTWDHEHGTHAPPAVSVNLSARDLRDPDLPRRIGAAVAERRLRPQRLCLELTESDVVAGKRSIEAITSLRDTGMHIAIDDFGVGNSSLARLARLPVSQIKIDRSFVNRMLVHDTDRKVIRLIVGLGRDLGMTVVAEGIETGGEEQALRDLAVHLGQGYHFSRPVPADTLLAWSGDDHVEAARRPA